MDRPQPSDRDREAALAALHALLGTLSEPATVSVQTSRGMLASIVVFPPRPVLPPPPPSPPQARPDDERDCRADIIAVLAEAGRRLTTTQILAELNRRDWHHGERTVSGYLADMVEDGALTNDRRARPPGYAPAERPQ